MNYFQHILYMQIEKACHKSEIMQNISQPHIGYKIATVLNWRVKAFTFLAYLIFSND